MNNLDSALVETVAKARDCALSHLGLLTIHGMTDGVEETQALIRELDTLRTRLAGGGDDGRVDANLDAALNATVSDLDMLAQGRDTVTGDPLTMLDSRRIATNALSALTRAWQAALNSQQAVKP